MALVPTQLITTQGTIPFLERQVRLQRCLQGLILSGLSTSKLLSPQWQWPGVGPSREGAAFLRRWVRALEALGWYSKGSFLEASPALACSLVLPYMTSSWPPSLPCHTHSLTPAWCRKGPLPDAGIMPAASSSHRAINQTRFLYTFLGIRLQQHGIANRPHLCPSRGLKGFTSQALPCKAWAAPLFLPSMNHSSLL